MRSSRAVMLRLVSPALVAGLLAVPANAQVGAVGLSPYRGRVFENENILINVPTAFEHFASALAVGDFNGDGADDLATGIPGDAGIPSLEVPGAGAVIVRYGSRGQGLRTPAATNLLSQQGDSNPDPAEEGDHFGFSLAACDFNRDGYGDLAIGIPDDDHGETNAGAVQIHYGSPAGLPADGNAFYAQSTPGIPGDSEEGDRFGYALACGDFNGDGYADLAIGAPFESREATLQHSAVFFHGMVDIVPGSATGLQPSAAYGLDQETDGMDGGIDTSDVFGFALAAGSFDGGIYGDLAVGIPGEGFDDWNGGIPVGAVQVVFGGPAGANGSNNIMFSGNAFLGTQDEERFGGSLATGDLDGDGKDDLAIGVAQYDVNSGGLKEDAGAVAVVYGAGGIGIDLGRAEWWTQDSILGSGNDEALDLFGRGIAIADFDGDGIGDLALGHPGEATDSVRCGAVTVMPGTPSGSSAARHRLIVPGAGVFPGSCQADQAFGNVLAAGDFDADGHADLAIGVPQFDLPGAADAGEEVVLYGSIQSDGFEWGFDPVWLTQAVAPAGASLGSIGFPGPAGLAVSTAGGIPAYVRHDMPTGISTYRARFYARLWPLEIAPNRYFVLLEGRDAQAPVFRLYVNRGSGENGITVGLFDNLGDETFAPLLIPVPDGWRALEVNWRAGSPGSFTLWVDGHFYDLLGGVANGQRRLRTVRWGAVDLLGAATSGTFFVDEYVATRFDRAGEMASFYDAPLSSVTWPSYQALFNAEVTRGCAAGLFCPGLAVTREQFARFLLASHDGPSITPAPCASSPFADVPASSPFCPWVRELAARGITNGCGAGRFCPTGPITREQAALWLQRAREGAGQPPPDCTGEPASDVSRDSPYCPYIRYVLEESISSGCGGAKYCPSGVVTREQLAPLLIEAFDLFVPVR